MEDYLLCVCWIRFDWTGRATRRIGSTMEKGCIDFLPGVCLVLACDEHSEQKWNDAKRFVNVAVLVEFGITVSHT